MSIKSNETLVIWQESYLTYLSGTNYLPEQMTAYLNVFDDLPPENKREIIGKFAILLSFYFSDNEPKSYGTHNKVISKELYKLLNKELKVYKSFVEVVEKNGKLDTDTLVKVKNLIDETEEIIATKAVTKTKIKDFLLKCNIEFNLKKTHQIKELIDDGF